MVYYGLRGKRRAMVILCTISHAMGIWCTMVSRVNVNLERLASEIRTYC